MRKISDSIKLDFGFKDDPLASDEISEKSLIWSESSMNTDDSLKLVLTKNGDVNILNLLKKAHSRLERLKSVNATSGIDKAWFLIFWSADNAEMDTNKV